MTQAITKAEGSIKFIFIIFIFFLNWLRENRSQQDRLFLFITSRLITSPSPPCCLFLLITRNKLCYCLMTYIKKMLPLRCSDQCSRHSGYIPFQTLFITFEISSHKIIQCVLINQNTTVLAKIVHRLSTVSTTVDCNIL